MEYKIGKTYDRVKTAIAWRAALHRHHDHRSDEGLKPRFPPTIICGACNSADGTAKRLLRLPNWFSFAPEEIAYFVKATPHALHSLDLDKAREVWTYESPRLITEVQAARYGD